MKGETMQRKIAMGPKPKKVSFQIIEDPSPAHDVLSDALAWHPEINGATIKLAWRKGTKADVDGRIVLGRCVKVSDLHREFFNADFIVVLNREYWDAFTDKQRLALMDHELSHAAAKEDKNGNEMYDERDRQVFRTRKHDLEEFRDVVERHGLYKADLVAFAEVMRSAKKTPLFGEEKAS